MAVVTLDTGFRDSPIGIDGFKETPFSLSNDTGIRFLWLFRYPLESDAFKFIRSMSREHPPKFEQTVSAHVGKTYGVPADFVKRIKARFRTELSISQEGK